MADSKKGGYDAVAKKAYDYVKDRMIIGAGNDPWGERGKPNPVTQYLCVYRMRRETDKDMNPMADAMVKDFNKRMVAKYGLSPGGKTVSAVAGIVKLQHTVMVMETYGKSIDIYANNALVFGCGNCMEQSALTFQYLRDRGVRPLDWIAQERVFTIGIKDFGDHQFVIIGRNHKTDVGDISTWNPEVVWCDPYENQMGGLDKIKKRFKGHTLSLRYRLD